MLDKEPNMRWRNEVPSTRVDFHRSSHYYEFHGFVHSNIGPRMGMFSIEEMRELAECGFAVREFMVPPGPDNITYGQYQVLFRRDVATIVSSRDITYGAHTVRLHRVQG